MVKSADVTFRSDLDVKNSFRWLAVAVRVKCSCAYKRDVISKAGFNVALTVLKWRTQKKAA